MDGSEKQYEEMSVIIQGTTNAELVDQRIVDETIAKHEADGWKLVNQQRGVMDFGSVAIPLVGCLFRRTLPSE